MKPIVIVFGCLFAAFLFFISYDIYASNGYFLLSKMSADALKLQKLDKIIQLLEILVLDKKP